MSEPRCPRCELRRDPGTRGLSVPMAQGQTPLLDLGAGGPFPPGGYTLDHQLVQVIAQAVEQWVRSQAVPRPRPGAPAWRQYPCWGEMEWIFRLGVNVEKALVWMRKFIREKSKLGSEICINYGSRLYENYKVCDQGLGKPMLCWERLSSYKQREFISVFCK